MTASLRASGKRNSGPVAAKAKAAGRSATSGVSRVNPKPETPSRLLDPSRGGSPSGIVNQSASGSEVKPTEVAQLSQPGARRAGSRWDRAGTCTRLRDDCSGRRILQLTGGRVSALGGIAASARRARFRPNNGHTRRDRCRRQWSQRRSGDVEEAARPQSVTPGGAPPPTSMTLPSMVASSKAICAIGGRRSQFQWRTKHAGGLGEGIRRWAVSGFTPAGPD